MLKQIKTLMIILSILVLSSCSNKIYYMSTPETWNNNNSWEYQGYDYNNKCEVYYGIDGFSIASLYYIDTLITKIIYNLPSNEAANLYTYLVNDNNGKCDGNECKFKYGKAIFIKEKDNYYTVILMSKR